MEKKPARRGLRRGIARGVLVLAVLVAAGVLTAPLTIHGRTAGALIERLLPPMRGRVHVGGARWTYVALFALARGRPAHLELEDVRLDDPSGIEVLRVGRVAGTLELSRSPRGAVVRDAVLEHVSWRFVDRGNGVGVGFLQALRPPARPSPPTGQQQRSPSTTPSFAFSMVNARIADLTAQFDFPGWGLTLGGVAIESGALDYQAYVGRRDAFTFEVRGAAAGRGGRLRIGGGAAAWTFAFPKARLDRVATTIAMPDAIHLEASDIVRGQSRVAVRGDFRGVYGVSGPPVPAGLALEVTAQRAADLLGELARERGLGTSFVVVGPSATASAKVAGPYRDVRVSVDASNLALRYQRIELSPVSFRLELAPAVGQYRASDIRIGWRDLGVLTGALAVDVQGGVASVRDVNIALVRPAGAVAPRVIALESRGSSSFRKKKRAPAGAAALQVAGLKFIDGEVRAQHLTLPVLGGVLELNGRLALFDQKGRWLTSPVVDVSLAVRALGLERVLGSRFVRGTLAFRAQVRGPLTALRCEVDFPSGAALTIFGEPLAFPRRIQFAFADGGTYVHVDLTGAQGAKLGVVGRVRATGQADFEVTINNFPLGRLPGVAETGLAFGGPIWGKLRVTGDLDALSLAGKLEIYPVTFQGRRAGLGKVAVTTDPSGTLRVRGQLMDGVGLDGWLRAEAGGARGEARLSLNNFETDALGISVPGGLGVRGAVSGLLIAHVAPGRPSGIEGKLSALTLRLTPPRAAAGRGTRPVELRTEGPVEVSAQADGTVALGPAHFAGGAGDFVMALRSRGDQAEGSLRGRVELAPLAPILSRWVDAPTGSLDVDLSAARPAPAKTGSFAFHGSAAVRTPVSFRLGGGNPIDLRVPSGRIRIAGDAIEASGLPVTFTVGGLPSLPIRRVAGTVAVDARLAAAAPDTAALRARVAIGHVEFAVPLLGSLPVTVEGGRFSVDGALDTPERLSLTDVDVPVRGTARRVTTPAGTIDHALFDLRLHGASPRALTLSGDVDVVAAHAKANQLGGAASAGQGNAGVAKPVDLDNPRLDLRVRSRRGAVAVELAHGPDVHVDLDLRVGGTLARPTVSGQAQPVGIYSTILMALKRLFD